jgi:hypothetical protein
MALAWALAVTKWGSPVAVALAVAPARALARAGAMTMALTEIVTAA